VDDKKLIWMMKMLLIHHWNYPLFLHECTNLVCKDVYIRLYCAEWCWKLPHLEEPTNSVSKYILEGHNQ
jgi:hypothetical protein